MPWHRIDDGWWRHRKTRRLLKSHPAKQRDAGAAGLWALAGNWCAGSDTDGWIPEDELEQFDDDWPELAKRAVDAEYFAPEPRNGEPGYVLLKWLDYNPTKAEREAEREAAGRGGREGNHLRWHARRGVVMDDCEFCQAAKSPPSRGRRSGKRSPPASRPPDRGTDSPPPITPESPPSRPPDQVPDSPPDRGEGIPYGNPPGPARPGPTRPDTGSPLY